MPYVRSYPRRRTYARGYWRRSPRYRGRSHRRRYPRGMSWILAAAIVLVLIALFSSH